jgi:O-antigen/teichoic acid export membrane protein
MLRIFQKPRIILNILSGDNLTKKAYLNAFTAILDYGATLVVGFLITPLMVAGLGDYYYGLWQLLNRLVGYLTPASGRPAQALKWTLANQQTSNDYDLKRRQIGNTIVVWLIFLPIMIVTGAALAWLAPYWLKIQPQYIWLVRVTIGILVANLIVYSLSTTPQSILEGQNLGYKRMGQSVLIVFLGGGVTWFALYLKSGVIGVAWAALATTILTGLFYLKVAYDYSPWLGIARPLKHEIREFLGLSWWFLGWNLVTSLMFTLDVVVLGILSSVESVTTFTLTKYAPETLISLIAIMVFGVTPGLGGILGSGNLKKASGVRGEIMCISWLLVTSLGAAILFWNRTFLNIWVGDNYFAGSFPNLLITIAVVQLVMIRNDANVIDLTLRLQKKVIFGGISVLLSIIGSVIFLTYFHLGIVGVSLGLILGRLILSICYPIFVGNFLNIRFSSQIKSIIRPGIFLLLFFSMVSGFENLNSQYQWIHIHGWIDFSFYAGISFLFFLLIAFYAGLTNQQRGLILMRLKLAFSKVSS